MTTYNVVQAMSLDQIQDRFVAMGRGDNFSNEALEAILDMLEDCNEGYINFDVIAICCNFTEASLEDVQSDYSIEGDSLEEVLDNLQDSTWAVGLSNGNILYMNY